MCSISIVNTLKPNIYFSFVNISSTDRSLQVFYKLGPYKGSVNSLNIDKTVDIFMIDYFSSKTKTIAAKKIFFYNKSTGELISDASMVSKSGNRGTKFIFTFQLRNSFQNISKCLGGFELMLHAKIFVLNINVLNDVIKSVQLPKKLKIYRDMDAYLTICNKSFKDVWSDCENLLEFCKSDENNELLCLMTLFIVGMVGAQTIVVIMLNCSNKCSKRVYPITDSC